MSLRENTFLACAVLAALAITPPVAAASAPLKPGIIDANPHSAVIPAGQTFVFKVVARNVDKKRATAVQPLSFYLSNSKSVKGARKVGSDSIPSLPAKTSRAVFDFSAAIPSNVKPGGYRFMVCSPRSGELPHCSKTIKLSVRKALPPKLEINLTSTDFGSHAITATSMDEAYIVTNNGGSPSGTITTSLTGADPGEFTVISDDCDGHTLAVGASCTVRVAFKPTEARLKSDPEHPAEASLQVGATPGGSVGATLTGQGLPPVTLEVTPDHDFGEIPFGGTSTPFEFTVKNTGLVTSGPLNVISSGLNSGDYQVVAAGNTCTGNTLAPGATCVVSAQFTGGHLDSSGYLRAYDTSWEVAWGLLVYADSLMTGQEQTLAIDPTSYDYGDWEVLEPAPEQTFTITNHSGLDVTGAAVVKEGAGAAAVTIEPGTTCGATLAAGASCQIKVSFFATTGGPQSATVGYRGSNEGQTVEAVATVSWNGI